MAKSADALDAADEDIVLVGRAVELAQPADDAGGVLRAGVDDAEVMGGFRFVRTASRLATESVLE